jgi:hypothetical protein
METEMRNGENIGGVRLLADAELDHVSGGVLLEAMIIGTLAGIGFLVGQGIGDLPPGMSVEEAASIAGVSL